MQSHNIQFIKEVLKIYPIKKNIFFSKQRENDNQIFRYCDRIFFHPVDEINKNLGDIERRIAVGQADDVKLAIRNQILYFAKLFPAEFLPTEWGKNEDYILVLISSISCNPGDQKNLLQSRFNQIINDLGGLDVVLGGIKLNTLRKIVAERWELSIPSASEHETLRENQCTRNIFARKWLREVSHYIRKPNIINLLMAREIGINPSTINRTSNETQNNSFEKNDNIKNLKRKRDDSDDENKPKQPKKIFLEFENKTGINSGMINKNNK